MSADDDDDDDDGDGAGDGNGDDRDKDIVEVHCRYSNLCLTHMVQPDSKVHCNVEVHCIVYGYLAIWTQAANCTMPIETATVSAETGSKSHFCNCI